MLDKEELEKRFPVVGVDTTPENSPDKMAFDITMQLRFTAELFDQVLPDGRNKSLALTDLENAELWALKWIDELRGANE